MKQILTVLAAIHLVSCDSSVEWQSGDYEVYTIDASNDSTLGLEVDGGGRIGRVGPQVFAVGEDKKWIVAGSYPYGDKTRKEFFYFAKSEDHPHKNGHDVVLGPFTEAEFTKLSVDLNLPGWSKNF